MACVFALAGCDSPRSAPPQFDSSAASAPSLIVSPDPIALGTLAPGESARSTVTLRNPTSEAVSVERIETSCPCILVSPTSIVVGSGESSALTIEFDPTDEPEFRGGLSVNVVGKEATGRVALRGRVEVEVRRSPVSAEGGSRSETSVGDLSASPVEILEPGSNPDGDL